MTSPNVLVLSIIAPKLAFPKCFAMGKKVWLRGGCLGVICCLCGFAFWGSTSAPAHRWKYFTPKCLSWLETPDGDELIFLHACSILTDRPCHGLLLHQEVSLHLCQAHPCPSVKTGQIPLLSYHKMILRKQRFAILLANPRFALMIKKTGLQFLQIHNLL